MASDFIGIDLQGLPELRALLNGLPQAVRDAVIDDVSKYLINVLKLYPPQKSVSRRQAYGVTFFTEKQRRWFFASLKDGSLEIPYRRTQTLANGWKQVGSGESSIIANETPYAALVMGAGEQSRHAVAIGWKDVNTIVDERMGRIDRIAEAAAEKGMRKAGA